MDQETRNLLINAKEEDYYLSNMSPLGVPFNTIRGTSNDEIKDMNISNQKFGSSIRRNFWRLAKSLHQKELARLQKISGYKIE